MNIAAAIELSITKATAAEGEAEFYASVYQSDAYQTDVAFKRRIDARIAAAQDEAAFQQAIKVALVSLPE